jgi:hypothetical protein
MSTLRNKQNFQCEKNIVTHKCKKNTFKRCFTKVFIYFNIKFHGKIVVIHKDKAHLAEVAHAMKNHVIHIMAYNDLYLVKGKIFKNAKYVI